MRRGVLIVASGYRKKCIVVSFFYEFWYPNPSSVKFGGVFRGGLLETTPGKAFIHFVVFRKHQDIPGFEPDLMEEG